jgi:hypothetical protein
MATAHVMKQFLSPTRSMQQANVCFKTFRTKNYITAAKEGTSSLCRFIFLSGTLPAEK